MNSSEIQSSENLKELFESLAKNMVLVGWFIIGISLFVIAAVSLSDAITQKLFAIIPASIAGIIGFLTLKSGESFGRAINGNINMNRLAKALESLAILYQIKTFAYGIPLIGVAVWFITVVINFVK